MNARVVVRAGNSESSDLRMDEECEPTPTVRSGFGNALLMSKPSAAISMVTEKQKTVSLIPQTQKPSQNLDQGRIQVYQIQPRRVGDTIGNPFVVIRVQRYVVITKDEAEELDDAIVVQHEDAPPEYRLLKWFELGGKDIRLIRESKYDRGSWYFRIAPDEVELPKEVQSFARFVTCIQAFDVQHEERRIFVSPEAEPEAIKVIFEHAYPTPDHRAPPRIDITRHSNTYLCIRDFVNP